MFTEMKNALHGMHWSKDIALPAMRTVESLREGLFIMHKNSPDIIWNTLGTFENNPCTLAQTETILQGISVDGLSFRDLDQVRNLGATHNRLRTMLLEGSFNLDVATACSLHSVTGKEEALKWGVFRDGNVALNNVEYAPPDCSVLVGAFDAGMKYLSECVPSPQVRGLAVFLFMSRMQFFFDCNKRTALLMTYGELLRNNISVFIIPKAKQGEFNTLLRDFYNTGKSDAAMVFLAEQGRSSTI